MDQERRDLLRHHRGRWDSPVFVCIILCIIFAIFWPTFRVGIICFSNGGLDVDITNVFTL